MIVGGHEVLIRRVDRSCDETLHNLFEFYLHDMAEWFKFDYAPTGRYGGSMSDYWDKGIEAWFAYVGEIPIGFALVWSAKAFTDEPGVMDMDEFFVARRYRRGGVGRAFARHVWNAYPNPWLVRVYQGNLPALPFWRGAIAEYSAGEYREEVRTVNGRTWSYFTFTAATPSSHP